MKINLGCGKDIKKNYINIDITQDKIIDENTQVINFNLKNGIPEYDLFKRKIEIDYVYSSHFIEHLNNNDAFNLMKHCYNRMNSGAIFRMALPNFKKAFKAYIDQDVNYFSLLKKINQNNLIIEYIEYSVYQFGEHLSLWDEEKSCFYLLKSGFKQVQATKFDENVDIDNEVRKKYSFYIEAIK